MSLAKELDFLLEVNEIAFYKAGSPKSFPELVVSLQFGFRVWDDRVVGLICRFKPELVS